MEEFIKAALLVVVAEMGDKTQLLAMAFASKYKVKEVMIGVLIATIFNHALAVAVGNYVSSFIPMDYIKILAGISFLIFGFWTLRGDTLDGEDKKPTKFGPIVTVTIAFFLAEMGDKTQLMTIAIAADTLYPLLILMGTTVGMLIADAIGIIGGAWMSKRVPEKYVKLIAGLVFIFFGSVTLYEVSPEWILTPIYIASYLVIVGVISYLIMKKSSNKIRENELNEIGENDLNEKNA
ncbi:MAG: TMEM165/GDT1 family protein [Clostridiaceae bacterium]